MSFLEHQHEEMNAMRILHMELGCDDCAQGFGYSSVRTLFPNMNLNNILKLIPLAHKYYHTGPFRSGGHHSHHINGVISDDLLYLVNNYMPRYDDGVSFRSQLGPNELTG